MTLFAEVKPWLVQLLVVVGHGQLQKRKKISKKGGKEKRDNQVDASNPSGKKDGTREESYHVGE